MRCSEVTRELSAPDGGTETADLERHLSACPDCSAWADRSAGLDRIWAATRPAEPPPAAFDALWARVSEAADAEPARPIRFPLWGVTVAGLAAAAALLVACFAP